MTVISSPTRTLLALSSLKGVGPASLKRIAAFPNFWNQSLERWSAAVLQVAKSVEGRPFEVAWREAMDWADEQVAAAEKCDARIISPLDDEYPELLSATKDDPFLLFVKGRLADSPDRSVAIIGTREPTPHGRLIARRITQFFVEQRWSVVSGLAIGCDAIAHQTAIEAGGHTVAVLAHGLQMIAPSRHQQLAEEILAAGGALVSEYPFGRTVLGAQYVKRDRTQAGMSQGVVMIQSDIKGGSLYASRAALDYQRWLAVPYPTDKDRENGEPKVQANLVIADGMDAQRTEILRCQLSALRLIRVVRGREDYLRLMAPEDAIAHGSSGDRPLAPLEEGQSKEKGQTQSLDPIKGSSEVESTSVRGSLALTGSESGEAPKQARPTEVLALPSEVVQHDKGVAVLLQGQGAYCLESDAVDLGNLTIENPLALASKSVLEERLHLSDIDTVLVFSRLEYLQAKLDSLKKSLASKRPRGQRASRIHFEIEDLLTHMKRSAEDLVRLDRGAHCSSLVSIPTRYGAVGDQAELPLSEAFAVQFHDVPFISVLDSLVDALPGSVSCYGHMATRDMSLLEGGCVVHLDDLICSFNKLIKAVSQDLSGDTV